MNPLYIPQGISYGWRHFFRVPGVGFRPVSESRGTDETAQSIQVKS